MVHIRKWAVLEKAVKMGDPCRAPERPHARDLEVSPGLFLGNKPHVTLRQGPFDYLLGEVGKENQGNLFLVLLLTNSVDIFLFLLFCPQNSKR